MQLNFIVHRKKGGENKTIPTNIQKRFFFLCQKGDLARGVINSFQQLTS